MHLYRYKIQFTSLLVSIQFNQIKLLFIGFTIYVQNCYQISVQTAARGVISYSISFSTSLSSTISLSSTTPPPPARPSPPPLPSPPCRSSSPLLFLHFLHLLVVFLLLILSSTYFSSLSFFSSPSPPFLHLLVALLVSFHCLYSIFN